MATENEEFLFNNALCERVKRLRVERGWTAEQMAKALGIPPDRYRKYENRSPLPAYLMERFALLANTTVSYLVTGQHQSSTILRSDFSINKRA